VEVVRFTGVVLEVEDTGNTVESALVQGVQGCRHTDVRGYVLVMMHAIFWYSVLTWDGRTTMTADRVNLLS
jgi:hypothetical protein